MVATFVATPLCKPHSHRAPAFGIATFTDKRCRREVISKSSMWAIKHLSNACSVLRVLVGDAGDPEEAEGMASPPYHWACKAKKLICKVLSEQWGEKLRSLGIRRTWWLEVVGTSGLVGLAELQGRRQGEDHPTIAQDLGPGEVLVG